MGEVAEAHLPRTSSRRTERRSSMNHASRTLLNTVIAFMVGFGCLLMVPSCGGSGLGQSPEAKMRSDLSRAFGDAIGDQLSDIWQPLVDAQSKAESAVADEDFGSYHAAMMEMRDATKRAVSESIRILEADPSWKRKLFVEAVAASASEQKDESEAEEVAGLFPSMQEPDKEWLARGMASEPRLAGEFLRASLEMQGELMRFGLYFAGAMGQETMKAASEAMEGFQSPR